MYTRLLLIIIPLMIGYLLPRLSDYWLKIVNRTMSIIIYIILLLMSIRLSCLPHLASNLLSISIYTAVSALCILTMNVLALNVLEKALPWKGNITNIPRPSYKNMIINSFKYCAVILIGFLVGLTHWSYFQLTTKICELILILVLWLVGIQLRNSNISLRQMILNHHGLLVTAVVAISALIGGILAAVLLGLPVFIGLALASAYGWYSLSGILMTDACGPIIGSVAFFTDLVRELLAIALIPFLIQHKRTVALGLCGADSLDFILPILRRSGGIEIVPAAIIQGFLLSMLAPILITIFTSHINNYH